MSCFRYIMPITSKLGRWFLLQFFYSKSRNNDVSFTSCSGSGLYLLLPFTSESGRDILKLMLVYDPDVRSNVRRLLDHRYFNDLR